MGKLLIEVIYNDGMTMSVDQMRKNIVYVLSKHFEDMPGYTKVNPPRIDVSDEDDES